MVGSCSRCVREERWGLYFVEEIALYCHFGSWYTDRRQGHVHCLEWRNVKFGVLNVYAPNSSSERTSFWSELANKLPSYDNWIVARDFNMTERADDCLGAHSNLL